MLNPQVTGSQNPRKDIQIPILNPAKLCKFEATLNMGKMQNQGDLVVY